MPHQCTSCGHVFADGSKEMLSGCPDCGGNKFQFHPSGSEIPDQPEPDAQPPDRPGEDSVAGTVGSAAATVRNLVGGNAPASGGADRPDGNSGSAGTDADSSVAGIALDEDPTGSAGDVTQSGGEDATRASVEDATQASAEDAAQASARTDVVSPDELPDAGTTATPPVDDGTVVQEPDDDDDDTERPDLAQLREELNEQFESIKVLEPGQYELNLMELYDREEYIIALQEDGKYSIQVPETWRD